MTRRARGAATGIAWLPLVLSIACASTLDKGERLYRDGDTLGALETWRDTPIDDPKYDEILQRVRIVETEFRQLVTRYKQRGHYFEDQGRLAESILNYRLALKLQPDDAATLERVQTLARSLAESKRELEVSFGEAFNSADLRTARDLLSQLRSLDALDPELETQERQLDEALRIELTRRLSTGRVLFTAGNHEAARRTFEGVLELDPENESARGYLSYIRTIRRESVGLSEAPAAIDSPSESFATDSEIRAEGFFQNAVAAYAAGDVYAAVRYDMRALEANPEHAEARAHLEGIRTENRRSVEPLIERGRTAFRNENLQLALDLWRRAHLLDPDNERIRAYIDRAERQLANLERLRREPEVAAEAG
jgi:tetratricopeptide (TPR) repeat protein